MIANDILEALANTHLSGHELRVLLLIIRNTYGYHKKETSKVTLTYIATFLKSSCSNISRTIRLLTDRKMITVIKNDNGKPKTYCFNKDFDSWKGVIKNDKGYQKREGGVIKNDKGGLSKMIRVPLSKMITVSPCESMPESDSGDLNILYKDNIKDNSKDTLLLPQKFGNDSVEFKLANLLFNLIKQRNPNHKPPNYSEWVKHIDLMIRRDDRHPENIKRVIEWCQNDEFWQNNILSTKKLRVQYDQLFLKMTKNTKPKWKSGLDEWLRLRGDKIEQER